jgi:hypothetical protein
MRKSSGTPTLAVSVAKGIEASSYTAVAESPLDDTSDAVRQRFTIGGDATGVNIRIAQTGASTKTEIYGLEIEQRPYPQSKDGNG